MSEIQEHTVSGTTDSENKIEDRIASENFEIEEQVDILSSTTDGVEDLPSFNDEKTSNPVIPDDVQVNQVEEGTATEKISDKELQDSQEVAVEECQELSLKSPLAMWMMKQNVNNTVIKLLYWKDAKRTAGVFVGVLMLMLSLHCYSFISVVTTFAMSLLIVAALYRIGMTIVNAVQKTSAEHPFKNLLEEDIQISENSVEVIAQHLRETINKKIKCLQKLFLIEDFFQSLKFGVILWLLSYIGHWFSFLTLAILAFIGLFTIPKLYEEKQNEIDQGFDKFKRNIDSVTFQIEKKLPEKFKKYLAKDKNE